RLHRLWGSGQRPLSRPGASRRPAGAGRQGPAPEPPADGLQCAGLRRPDHGLSCRRPGRAPAPQAGGVTVRRAQRLTLEQLAPALLALPEPPRPYPWPEVFGNEHPVEIEVGFGKGLFLVTATAACPEVNFLGIEIARKYQLFTATRLIKRGAA